MENVIAVIGAGFGDEGKGLTTDYYASKSELPVLVVRFSGAPQASHTVETPSGRRHSFSHIGSGTFVGADTFLSRYFVVNPITFRREMKELDLPPRVFVDRECLVTTPYDMMLNQLAEMNRKKRHGSCGAGFNETIHRSEDPRFLLRVVDLGSEDTLRGRLKAIETQYFQKRKEELGITQLFGYDEYLESPHLIDHFIQDCQYFRGSIYIWGESILQVRAGSIIFEGAQGLLLDQDCEFFPYVTRSKTGLPNVARLCGRAGIKSIDVTYVTRAYTTRHGVGPLPFELNKKPYDGVFDHTNIDHEFQGSLRFSYLNLDLISSAITWDINSTGLEINPTIMMTCIDQVSDPFCYIFGGSKREGSVEEVQEILYRVIPWEKAKKPKFLVSAGATRDTVMAGT